VSQLSYVESRKAVCSVRLLWFVDSPKTKAGGLAFEVILKPAAADNLPQISSSTPTKERSISQEFIEKKLKDAEERRQVILLLYYWIADTGSTYQLLELFQGRPPTWKNWKLGRDLEKLRRLFSCLWCVNCV